MALGNVGRIVFELIFKNNPKITPNNPFKTVFWEEQFLPRQALKVLRTSRVSQRLLEKP